MANTAQARKRARQAVKLNAHNSSQRSALRTAIKTAQKRLLLAIRKLPLPFSTIPFRLSTVSPTRNVFTKTRPHVIKAVWPLH